MSHDNSVRTIQRMTLAASNDSVQNEIVGSVTSDTTDALVSGTSTDVKRGAGEIFLSEIVKDVVSETRELNEEIMEKEQLLDYTNKIELRFGSVDPTYVDGNVEVISARFSQAAIYRGGKFLFLPLSDNKPIPLRKMGKGILIVSSHITGVCNAREKTSIDVEVKSRDPSSVVICLTGTSKANSAFFIKGQVKHLSDDDCLAVANNSKDENRVVLWQYLVSGQGLDSPEAVFIPKCLALEHTSTIEDRVKLVKSAITIPKFLHVSNAFRHSVIDAIGTKSDINLLQQNCAAKFKKEVFTLLEDMIATVEIIVDSRSSSSSFKFDLRQGRLVKEYNYGSLYHMFIQSSNQPAWVLRLNGAASTCSFDIEGGSLTLFVSGAEVCTTEITAYDDLPDGSHWGCHLFMHYAVMKCFKISETGPNYVISEFAFNLEKIEETLNILGISCNADA